MRKKIAVIFGGRSGEHEVSIRSAKTVIEQIDHERYDIIPVAIGHDGSWLSPADSLALFPNTTQDLSRDRFTEAASEKAIISGDSKAGGLVVSGGLENTPIDVVFPVLHGTFGEDGTIQGLFEMADIPYVGCGVLASSCGMDKVFMKTLFRDAGLPMCNYVWFLRSEWESTADTVIEQVEAQIGYPAFVKPANLGSSVGVSRAMNAAELRAGITLAAEFDRKIIVEEGLDMREIECAVIGNDKPEASLPGEYIIRDESKKFLDYTEKYSGTGNNEFIVPAPVSDELVQRIKQMAVAAFKAIDGSGLARVDFFLRKDNGNLLINEINTLPGLTDASGFPKMWAGSGLAFRDVIERLIELALERHADRRRSRTSV